MRKIAVLSQKGTPPGENVIGREEASKLLGELEQMGHVHLAFFLWIHHGRGVSSVRRHVQLLWLLVVSARSTSTDSRARSGRTTGPSLIRKSVRPAVCASHVAR